MMSYFKINNNILNITNESSGNLYDWHLAPAYDMLTFDKKLLICNHYYLYLTI